MRGFPKHLNTRQDVLNVMTEYPVETCAYLQRLFDNRFNWLPAKTDKQEFSIAGKALSFNSAQKMTKGAVAVVDDTHRETVLKDDRTQEVTERYQEELKEDPNCEIFRLGLTVAEVSELLNSLKETVKVGEEIQPAG